MDITMTSFDSDSNARLLRTRPVVTFSFFKPKFEFHHRRVTTYFGKQSWIKPGASVASMIRNVDNSLAFQGGTLLESKEKGVIYPIIHRTPFYSWNADLLEGSIRSANGDEYGFQQGVYAELASVQADLFGSSYDDVFNYKSNITRMGVEVSTITPTWSTFYVVLGFMQIPKTPFKDLMERDWKDWTGARYLFLNLPDEFGLVKLTFYKRCRPSKDQAKECATDMDLFLYVLLAECVHVTDRQRIFIKDFVQRMRADRMPPYVALYEDVEASIDGRDASSLLELEETSKSSVRRRLRSSLSGSGSGSRSPSPISPRMATSPLFASPIPSFRTTLTISTR